MDANSNPQEMQVTQDWPDLTSRAEEVLGHRVIEPGAAQQILSDRDE